MPANILTNFGFGGAWFFPELGLYHKRNRWYDPLIGRFIQRDPLGEFADPLHYGDPYAFAGNSPWVNLDPYGLMSQIKTDNVLLDTINNTGATLQSAEFRRGVSDKSGEMMYEGGVAAKEFGKTVITDPGLALDQTFDGLVSAHEFASDITEQAAHIYFDNPGAREAAQASFRSFVTDYTNYAAASDYEKGRAAGAIMVHGSSFVLAPAAIGAGVRERL